MTEGFPKPKPKTAKDLAPSGIETYLWGVSRLYREDLERLEEIALEHGDEPLAVETEEADYISVAHLIQQPRESYRNLTMYRLAPYLWIRCRGLNASVTVSKSYDQAQELSDELIYILKKRQNKLMAVITNQFILLWILMATVALSVILSLFSRDWLGKITAAMMALLVGCTILAICWTYRKHVIVPKYKVDSDIQQWYRDPLFLYVAVPILLTLIGLWGVWIMRPDS